MTDQDAGFVAAVEEAKVSMRGSGVPIGACLVSKDGKVLGRGHNQRVQKSSATLHVSSRLFCSTWFIHRFALNLSDPGGDISIGERWTIASNSIRRCHHVHDIEPL